MSDEDQAAREGRGAEDDAVGSWGEEATRLFASVAGWMGQHGADVHRQADEAVRHTCEELHRLAEGFEEHVATGAQECSWCPVCRTIHAVRTVSPEVRTHLTAAAVSLAKAAAALLAAAPHAASGSTGPHAGRPAPEDRVQHIRLDDDPEPA